MNKHTNAIQNISIGEFHDMIKTCKFCETEFETVSKKASCCGANPCTDARSELYKKAERVRAIEKSRNTFTEANQREWVECKECGLRAGDLCSHISRVHNMSIEDYKNKYRGGSELINSSDNLNRKAKLIGFGSDNVAYQHDGKLSPWSLKSTVHSHDKIEECHSRAIENGKLVPSSNNIEWWIAKGYSKEEAKMKLSERQRTFTKEKCIENHGEVDGLRIWKERQYKWQETLAGKTDDEIEEINRKKAAHVNYRSLWRGDIPTDVHGRFYAIQVSDELVKIGVTTRELYQRYTPRVLDLDYIEIPHGTILESFRIEQVLKRHFRDNVIEKCEQVDGFGWTETFRITLDDVRSAIDNLDIDMLFEEIRSES